MGFQLVPKSVTLSDLQWHNGRSLHYFGKFGSFGTYYVKVVEDRPYFLRVKCSPKNLVFSCISIMAIFAGHHPQQGVKVKCPLVASKNLTNNH